MAQKPDSLAALFKSKAKKKPKATNLNAERAPPPPEPKVRRNDFAVAASGADAAAEGWERAFRRDQDLLKSCGLWIKEVEADGACLFRAFADQLDGDCGGHASYRERCVDFIKGHRADFEPFLEDDFDDYCERMRQPDSWGGHAEATALARLSGANVLIHRPADVQGGRPADLLSSSVEILTSEEQDSRCVQLSFHPTHHQGQHYNSVRCSDDEGNAGEAAPPVSLAEIRRRVDDALKPKVVEAAPTEEVAAAAEERLPQSRFKSRTVF